MCVCVCVCASALVRAMNFVKKNISFFFFYYSGYQYKWKQISSRLNENAVAMHVPYWLHQ